MIKFKAKIAKANRDARRHLDLRDMVGAIAKMAADAGAEPHRVAEILFDEMVVACERCGMKRRVPS